ncbi:MAG: aldehyde ferredoxin oxidoreductase family protein [Chloroflexi bacterium]|nr:aldehyde ferredoxin oxidoreductase family protein [Chloroflexota bacterium]
MSGYMGKLLWVDLTQGKIESLPLDGGLARDYIGGVGLGTRLVYDLVARDTDPLSPENHLVFAAGPLTGTTFPTSSRYEVCTRSPQTGIWLDAGASGKWGAELKRTGYDAIVIHGASPRPAYLLVTGETAELRDAADLWGQDAIEVQGYLRTRLGERALKVAAIGPAGERQVLITSIINDEGRVAGRGGAGAVMGSKKLKAIALRGRRQVPLARPEPFRQRVKEVLAALGRSPTSQALARWGTSANIDAAWITGDVPVQNWRRRAWKQGQARITSQKVADLVAQRYGACLYCPIKCSRWVRLEREGLSLDGPGPEYQTLATFGPLLLNDNLEVVLAANDLCNRYGLDTVSAGAAIAFAMEAYERGIVSPSEAGGLDLSWGNPRAILGLLRQMGERRGLGELLGQGVKRAAEVLGRGSQEFALHVKGMEPPMHDPRAFFAMAVNYATGPRGPDHMRGYALAHETGLWSKGAPASRFSDEGKGEGVRLAQDRSTMLNCLILCVFCGQALSVDDLAEVLTWTTGEPYTGGELLMVGERIVNLQRAFNLRCGVSGADDTLPPRLLRAAEEGGRVPDLARQLQDYYAARGWTADGVPTAQKLAELGLGGVSRDLGLEARGG